MGCVKLVQASVGVEPSGLLVEDERESLVGLARCFGWGSKVNLHDEADEQVTVSRLLCGEAFEFANAMIQERRQVIEALRECEESGEQDEKEPQTA